MNLEPDTVECGDCIRVLYELLNYQAGISIVLFKVNASLTAELDLQHLQKGSCVKCQPQLFYDL